MSGNEDRQRLSPPTARVRLVNAGIQMFLERGLDTGLTGLSFAEAIERAEVPRTSAYRAFPSKDNDPQDAFRVAVLLSVIGAADVDTSIVGTIFAGLSGSQFENTPSGQAAEFRELIRRWSGSILESNLANDELRAVEGFTQLTAFAKDPNPEFLDAVRESHRRSHEGFMPLYQLTAARYGLRFRKEVGLEAATSIFRAVGGMTLAEWTLQPGTRVLKRPTGRGGEMQDWTISGLIVESLARTLLEPDPEAPGIVADLDTWAFPT